ncbi:MAG: hypothetical protein WA687_14700, partial [Solirubrobacterales bacterium]
SWTASRRNSGGYGGLMGGIDSSLPESFDPSGQVSSKPGEDHTLCGCYLVGRLGKIETLHPEEAAVNLVIDDHHGILLDPDDIVEILAGRDLDNDGSIEFHLPSEIAIRIERAASG